VRVDSEIIGKPNLSDPEDVKRGEFLPGGEAWQAFRRREIDATKFGVYGTENWGPAEIKGNLLRDLAALNKVEMLPWDEWGPMRPMYAGETGEEFDEVLDQIAEICARDSFGPIASYYSGSDLRVPNEMIGIGI